jgi:hypothetical protein
VLRSKNTSLKVEEAKQKLRLAATEEPAFLGSIRTAARLYPKAGLLTGFAVGLILGMSAEARQTARIFLSSLIAGTSLPDHSHPEHPTEE